MTVVIGILALIGLAVVGAIGWAFAHGVRDGLATRREAPPGGTSQPVPVGEPPLPLSAALPSSYQAGQLAGEVAASWRSAHQAARTGSTAGVPASSSWAAALALGSELSQQRQEAGRAMQAAMAQVLQDNEQAVRAAASGGRDASNGGSGASSGGGVTDESSGDGASGGGVSPEAVPDGVDSNSTAEGTARPIWPAHASSRRPPRPRPRRCTQQRPARSDERQP
ncbi:hypothetical protein [Actinomyces naeslundii]|uniref:hypothetical protein n=1 Tax=Actinomyces naeslundii TaxID=1655 RepID=UPI003C6F1BE5